MFCFIARSWTNAPRASGKHDVSWQVLENSLTALIFPLTFVYVLVLELGCVET